MRDIYLIDFENVASEGLSGITELTEEDQVVIFYSANSNRLTMKMHIQIAKSICQLQYFEAVVGGKNALDHQISTWMGYLIGTHGADRNYYIVSRDTGYRHVASFWAANSPEPVRIYCIDAIRKAGRRLQQLNAQAAKAEAPAEAAEADETPAVIPAEAEPAAEATAEPEAIEATAEIIPEPEAIGASPEIPAEPEAAEAPEELPADEVAEEPAAEEAAAEAPAEEVIAEAAPEAMQEAEPEAAEPKPAEAAAPAEEAPAEAEPAEEPAEVSAEEQPARSRGRRSRGSRGGRGRRSQQKEGKAEQKAEPAPEAKPEPAEKPAEEKAAEPEAAKKPSRQKSDRQKKFGSAALEQLPGLLTPYPQLKEDQIRSLITENKRQVLCNTLRKQLGQEKGLALYNEIKRFAWK